jgi:hypothetical protein
MEAARVGIPERFTLEESGGTLRIQWKWQRVFGLALAVFAIGWDTFLVFWYLGISMEGPRALEMMLFPIGHVAVGIVLPYLAAAFLVNERSSKSVRASSPSAIGRCRFREIAR